MTEAHGRGAYGLRLMGYEDAHELLGPAGPDWQPVELSARVGDADPQLQWVRDDNALLRLRAGGQVEIDWLRGTAVFTLPAPADPSDLLHPYLATVAAIAAHRAGREGFHAGAFVVGRGAWAVLGDKGVGKSSLLALLAWRGHLVLADDVVILDERSRALAGPRFLDLRHEAADELGLGESIGVVGTRERYRVPLGEAPVSTPLSGFVVLGWGEDHPAVSRVAAADRLQRLYDNRIARLEPEDPRELLELATRPMLELRRPRDWRKAGAAADLLVEVLAASR
jgi:hypothetical protein